MTALRYARAINCLGRIYARSRDVFKAYRQMAIWQACRISKTSGLFHESLSSPEAKQTQLAPIVQLVPERDRIDIERNLRTYLTCTCAHVRRCFGIQDIQVSNISSLVKSSPAVAADRKPHGPHAHLCRLIS